MARKKVESNESFGSDSFLDVVANIVGILIILIMVTSVRAQRAPREEVELPEVDVASAQGAAVRLEGELLQFAQRLGLIGRQTENQRLALAALQRQRAEQLRELQLLEDTGREKQARIAEAERSLLELQRQAAFKQQALESIPELRPKVRTITTYPTPISRTVDGKEAHFQVLGSRIIYVPLDELIELVKDDARRKAPNLRNSPQLSATVGPLMNFSLSYTLERPEGANGAMLSSVTCVPESSQLGETLEEALRSQSRFRQALARLPAGATITLWTYPDSFAEYRELKRELYLMGYAVAGRPLPFGKLITASRHGSQSNAQ